MLDMLIFLGAGLGGFVLARDFVKRRLRFVDAVQHPATPWIVGIGAALVSWPLAALPLLTTATSAIFGLGTGLGTRSGAKALRSGERLPAKR
ncbi:MAG TPA: hypothetical protein VGA78_10425 [Gemmatimonadales bacterium]|jgi:hypothetical protein